MLDLNKLQVFAVVVEEGSFSKAAERLYVTQSAVSQHIKDLERRLGRQLFQRGWRGVRLTADGETLYGYTRQIFELVAAAENALTDVTRLEGGRVGIGATPGIAVYLAPEWVQGFRARYPGLTVALQTGVTPEIVAGVLARRLDFGCIEGELEDYRHRRLASVAFADIEQVVVVGYKHPWWERDIAPIAEMHGQPLIMRQRGSQTRAWLDETLARHGVEPAVGAEFDNLESIKRSVIAGQCLAVLPLYVAQDAIDQGLLHAVHIEGRPLARTLKIIWDRDQRFSPVARAFVDHLGQSYEGLRTLIAT